VHVKGAAGPLAPCAWPLAPPFAARTAARCVEPGWCRRLASVVACVLCKTYVFVHHSTSCKSTSLAPCFCALSEALECCRVPRSRLAYRTARLASWSWAKTCFRTAAVPASLLCGDAPRAQLGRSVRRSQRGYLRAGTSHPRAVPPRRRPLARCLTCGARVADTIKGGRLPAKA